MRIDRATTQRVRDVALAMRDRDFEEFMAVSPAMSRGELAFNLSAAYGMRDDVQVASIGDEPVAVIGELMLWPNVVSLLFFATPRFPEILRPIVRTYRHMFDDFEKAGVHRIQAVSLDGYTYTHRFLEAFGLKQEGGPLRGYGKNGEAFLQFARVRDVRPARD